MIKWENRRKSVKSLDGRVDALLMKNCKTCGLCYPDSSTGCGKCGGALNFDHDRPDTDEERRWQAIWIARDAAHVKRFQEVEKAPPSADLWGSAGQVFVAILILSTGWGPLEPMRAAVEKSIQSVLPGIQLVPSYVVYLGFAVVFGVIPGLLIAVWFLGWLVDLYQLFVRGERTFYSRAILPFGHSKDPNATDPSNY